MRTCIVNAHIISPFETYTGCIMVEDGKIIDLSNHLIPPPDAVVVDAKQQYLCPGFIDIHAHGGGGYEVLDGTVHSIVTIANTHAMHGTTTFLPSTTTSPIPQIEQAIIAAKEAAHSPELKGTIPGIHLEGPYVSPLQAGAQSRKNILVPTKNDWHWILPHTDFIRMIGIAPELEGAFEFAQTLAARGVVVSIAHSDAEYSCVEKAVQHGFSDVTHLYSGCSTVKRVKGFRIGGVVEAALTLDSLSAQIIADGCHLPPELIRLIYRCKGAENIELVSDALKYAAAGLEPGTVVTNVVGTQMIYKDGVMKLMDEQAFAGSVATADRLVRVAHAAGIPINDAVRMATDTPARRIGLTFKGRIAIGCDADLVMLDKNLQVTWIMARGKIIRDDSKKGEAQ